MKRSLLLAAIAVASTGALADKYTSGYVRKDGTYVQGHFSTNQNGTKWDNYSTQGNVNPYTGKPGTTNPYNSTYKPLQQPGYGYGRQRGQ